MADQVRIRNGMSNATEGDVLGNIGDIISNTGVVNLSGGHLLVTENDPVGMSVLVAGGIVYIPNADYDELDSDSPKYYPVVAQPEVLTIDPNVSGSTRHDIVCQKIDKAIAPDADASNVSTKVIVKGTPGAGVPTTPANHYKLAEIVIVNGETEITNTEITDTREQVILDNTLIDIDPTISGSTPTTLTGVITGNGSNIGYKANPVGALVGDTDEQDISNKNYVNPKILGGLLNRPRVTKHGMVTFWFDDGAGNDYTVLRPLFAAQGEVGALSLVTDITDGGSPNMTWAQAKTMASEGWEITNHTKSHVHLNALTEAEIEDELTLSQARFLANDLNPVFLAYPYNAHNELVRRISRKYFIGARADSDIVNPKVLDHYNLMSYNIDSFTLATIYKLIDQAYRTNTWLIFYGHSGSYGATEQANLNTVIDYIQALSMPIVTPSDGLEIMGNTIESGDSFGVNDNQVRIPAKTLYPEFNDNGGAGTVVTNMAVGAGYTLEFGNSASAQMTFTQLITLPLGGWTFMFDFYVSVNNVDPSIFYDASSGCYIRWRGSLNALYVYQDGTHIATLSVGAGAIQAGVTYHVAFVMNSNNKISLYLNGAFMQESGTVFTANIVFNQARNNLNTLWLRMNRIRAFSRAMTQAEIWLEQYAPYAVDTTYLLREFNGRYFLGTNASPTKFANVKQYDLYLP